MPGLQHDLHGSAPDKSDTALLLIDVINDFDFPEGRQLLETAVPAARRIFELKRRAGSAKVPIIYVNDNFGRWRSNFKAHVDHCLHDDVLGKPVAKLLVPEESDYFVLKAKHSAFYSTTLDLLLKYLGTKTVVITGFAGNICVLFTANDAYLRDLRVVVPSDCTASNTSEENNQALDVMAKILRAETGPSSSIIFEQRLQSKTKAGSSNNLAKE